MCCKDSCSAAVGYEDSRYAVLPSMSLRRISLTLALASGYPHLSHSAFRSSSSFHCTKLAAYLETASACGKSDDNVHEKRTVFPGQFPLRHFLLPCSVRVRVRSGVSRATVRVSGVRVSRVSSRVKVRVVVRFMV